MFEKLNNHQLVTGAKASVARKTKSILEILDYLCVIEDRRIFAELGYPHLFAFCRKELGYCEAAAQLRISSMRLIREISVARKKLEEGAFQLQL